jgi:hypothetical protein
MTTFTAEIGGQLPKIGESRADKGRKSKKIPRFTKFASVRSKQAALVLTVFCG